MKGSRDRRSTRTGGEGIEARAEIQQVFSRVFPLSFSGSSMNYWFWKINSHQIALLFSKILCREVINAFGERVKIK